SAPDLGGERRMACIRTLEHAPAVAPDLGGERRITRHYRNFVDPAVAPDLGGERRVVLSAIEDLQRRMAACKRGSSRYRKLRRQKARRQARESRQRRETMHLWTTSIAREFSELSIIAPAVKDHTTTARGTARNPGAFVETKAELNRHILRQAPAMAIAMLEYKLLERGGAVRVVKSAAPSIVAGDDLVTAGKELRRIRRSVKKELRT
ncbi:MAG: hypothetical protein ACREDC_05720, partial [Bradyrhizobium sp.]